MTENTQEPNAPLQGEAAIAALELLIQEIEESNPEELTERQAAIVTRVARLLITVIDQETPVWKSLEISGVFGRIKTAMGRLIDELAKTRPARDVEPTSVEDQALLLKVAENVKIRVARSAVAGLVAPDGSTEQS